MNIKKISIIIIPIIFCIILAIFCGYLIKENGIQKDEMSELNDTIKEMERKQIEVDSVREEIKQISKYCAYEYNYTSILCRSDKNNFMGITIPLTENKFIATIDGTMNIGIDGAKVDFSETKDIEGKTTQVELTVPHSKILDNYTIPESLKIYDEKNNIFNPVKVTDYNDLVIDAEEKEKIKVMESDILQRSDETIQQMLTLHFQTIYGNNVKINYTYLDQENE